MFLNMIQKNNKLGRYTEVYNKLHPRPRLTCFLGHLGRYSLPPGHVTCVNICVVFSVLRLNPPFPPRTSAFTQTRNTLGLGSLLEAALRAWTVSLSHRRQTLWPGGQVLVTSQSRFSVSNMLNGAVEHSESLSIPASA